MTDHGDPGTGLDTSAVPDYRNLLDLDGHGVVIVGAGNGIGRQCAHAVRAFGAVPLCVDIDAQRAAAVAAETGGLSCVTDVRSAEGGRDVAAAAAALPTLRGVIDIVGAARWGPMVETSDDDFDWALDMNVRHAFVLLRALAEPMAAGGGGSFVFIASVSGIGSAPWHAAYGAAKAGLLSLVRTSAYELGPRRVRVNAVSPGTTATPRMLRSGTAPSRWPQPLGGPAATSDIASAALFLTSDLARHVTGHNLVVDGGVTTRYPIPLPYDEGGPS